MGPRDLCFDFPFGVKGWGRVMGQGSSPLPQASWKPLCSDSLQGSTGGGEPAPAGWPFQSWRENEVVELPGPSADLRTRVGESVLVLVDLKKKSIRTGTGL